MTTEHEILDLIPDAVVLVGADGRIAHANVAAGRLLGRDPASLSGSAAASVLALRDEEGRDWWQAVRPMDVDARLLPRIPETDLTLQLEGGHHRPVTITGGREPDPAGGAARLVLCLRRAERRHRLDAARSDLVSTVSHEIRSPLTSVKGFVKTLLAKWDRFTDEQRRQMLATVNEDADRVTRLLGELLDVSRIDAGRLQLHRQMVEVPVVARRVVEKLAVGDRAGRAVVAIDEDIPKLYVDPDKVEQIFTNLVENALKYTDGKVVVGAEVSESQVTFSVTDEGPGISAAHVSHVFAKFFRPAGERRTGTGLGLYITKGLVQAHAGRIWVDSSVEDGSTFRFSLPRGGLELAGIEVGR